MLKDGPPARVVISEYLDVAHGFFVGDEPRMANGVLDALARLLRCEGARGRIMAWPRSAVDELPLGSELLDQVELDAVRGQHRDACLGGRQEDECIVQALLALMRLKPLRPRQRAGDDPGVGPDLRIGCHQPAGRNAREQLRVMILHRRPTRSRRIGVGDTARQFRKGHRTVEQQRLIDRRSHGRSKAPSRTADVDIRVEHEKQRSA